LRCQWAQENEDTRIGYKNYTEVDAKSKLIIGSVMTSANVHDSQVFQDLVNEMDNAVFADSAYRSRGRERYVIEECDCEEFIMFKSRGGYPLTEEEKATNTLRSRIGLRVEHLFGRMSQMGMNMVRTIGLKRGTQHYTLSKLVYNMDLSAFLMK
jgi:IS5 family transposase